MATSNVERDGDHRVVSFTESVQRKSRARREQAQDRVPVTSGQAQGHQLPRQPGALLGRDTELDLIHQSISLGLVRLLTLTGSGGVGKSRLAIEAARLEAPSFPDGVRFVDLASASDSQGVLGALADTFMLQDAGKLDLLESIKRHIGSRAMLLVLDSCETVLSASAVVSELVAACPHLAVIATSREPLHLRTEHVMPVSPLPVPDLDALPPLDQLVMSPSVALFLQRAQTIRLDFHLTELSAQDVAAICVRLEGLPLAIELAASQIGYLTPATILHRLIGHPALLRERAQDVPDRHRSMSDAIDWTYQQLDENERLLFRRLSVFAGGFSIEAANEVATPGVGMTDLLAELSSLVDKSLVQSTLSDNGEPRFVISELMRSYGREQLAHDPERRDVCECHAAYYLLLAERAAMEMQGTEQGAWLARLDQEQKNIRAAIQWAGESQNSALELRLVCALAGYWWFRGYVRTGIEMLRSALDRSPDGTEHLRAQALNALGVLLRWIGEYDQALSVHGYALMVAIERADVSLEATTRMNLGAALLAPGRFSEARIELDAALSACERARDTWGAAQTVLYLAVVALAEGDIERGEAHAAESLTVFQSLGDGRATAVALTILARAAAVNEDVSAAVQMLRDSLQLIQKLNEHRLISIVAEEVAWLASATDNAERAAQLLAGADVLRIQTGFARTASERQMYEAALERLHFHVDESALTRALEAGKEIPQEELIELALAMLRDLVTRTERETVRRGSAGSDVLSKREHEVLELVAQGMSNKQIADNLVISENTAKFHVTSILNKLGANSRAQIVALAARRHLLPR